MDYNKTNVVFQNMIAKSGTTLTIKRGTLSFTAKCIVTSIKSMAEGTTVNYEKLILVSSAAQAPKVGDTVIVQRGTYIISDIETIKPAETVMLYKIKVT